MSGVVSDCDQMMTYEMRQQELVLTLKNLGDLLFDEDDWSVKMAAQENALRTIYLDEQYRHHYHGICQCIFSLREEERELLAKNLEIMYKKLQKYNLEETHFISAIRKLYDHVMLEVYRLASLANYNDTVNNYQDISERLEISKEQTEQQIFQANNALREMQEKIEGFNTQSITVLGIFSAIVLASFGGINVIASAVASMHQTHFPKLIIVILACGFIMVNTIFVLMYFLGKMTRRNIYARCKTADCTCDKRCSGIVRIIKRLPLLFWLNTLFITLIAVMVVFWLRYLPWPWYI